MASDMVQIYTDGGCTGNPGVGGCGVVIDYGTHIEEYCQGYRLTTNNRMELMAVLVALENLDVEGPIKIYSDSQYTINVLSGKMNAAKNIDLVRQIRDVLGNYDVEYQWVRGHSGNRYNERCDKLSHCARNSHPLLADGGYEKEKA